MKKFLIAGIGAVAFCGAPALAADLPTKAPIYRPAPVALFNWTGCYFGANTGYAWADKSINLTSFEGSPDSMNRGSWNANGWAYGGQIGCDYQFNNNWVVGIRGMWDASNITGSHTLSSAPFLFTAGESDNVKIGSFGTVVGKLGYLLNPTVELYGLAGVAWVRDHYFMTAFSADFASGNQSRTGYDVGVGISWMFARNWDLWLEYDYMGFGTKNVTLIGEGQTFAGGILGIDVKQSVSKVLVGIDFRFPDLVGKAPVSAKY
jgi:outer membrane immunogenic protein